MAGVPALSSTAQMLAALGAARRVTFSAYVLGYGPVARALEHAASRGADVTVRLEGRFPHERDGIGARNRAECRRLRAAGANARLVRTGPPLHLKAAVCDRTVYLDDANWKQSGDSVLRYASPAARAVAQAILGRPAGRCGSLELDKDRALAAEAALIRSARRGDRVEVESEYFNVSRVSGAIRDAAKRGAICRVLVCHAPQTRIDALRALGVTVRKSASTEKLAVVNGARAWCGSANASSSYAAFDSVDWGARLDEPHIVRALDRRFDRAWNAASPL